MNALSINQLVKGRCTASSLWLVRLSFPVFFSLAALFVALSSSFASATGEIGPLHLSFPEFVDQAQTDPATVEDNQTDACLVAPELQVGEIESTEFVYTDTTGVPRQLSRSYDSRAPPFLA